MFKTFTFHICFYSQICLNLLINDCPFGYITKKNSKKNKIKSNLISDLKQEKKRKFKDHTCWPDTRPPTKYRKWQVCNQLKESLSITKPGRVLHSSANTKFMDHCVSLKPALSFTLATWSQHHLLGIVLNVGSYYIDLF